MNNKHSEMLEKLYNVDNGKFRELLYCVGMKGVCFRCGYFNPWAENYYRCRVIPDCPGATLSLEVKKHLFWKLGIYNL